MHPQNGLRKRAFCSQMVGWHGRGGEFRAASGAIYTGFAFIQSGGTLSISAAEAKLGGAAGSNCSRDDASPSKALVPWSIASAAARFFTLLSK